MLDKYVDNFKKEIIKKTQDLIQIPSVYSDEQKYKYPFGKNINKALEYTLMLGNSLGFRTKNIDNYCGYIEFGEGEEIFGIAGHLDVVPAENEDWVFPPFSGEIFDGNIYGRGSIDDKAPVIASIYAMKVVMDNLHVNRRIRLILGLDEERDWKCIEYYKKHEEIPVIGFSPDGNFPCIHAEKSVLSLLFKNDYDNSNDFIKITSIDSYSNPINVVPKICTISLKIDTLANSPKDITIQDVINDLKSIINLYNFEIDIYKIDDYNISLTSYGKSSHSAHPELGINALSRIMCTVNNLLLSYNINIPLLNFFSEYINTEYDGKSLGIDFKDESGFLSLNVSSFRKNNSLYELSINLRIPVLTPILSIGNILNEITSQYNFIDYDVIDYKPCLNMDKNSDLILKLTKIYNNKTNENSKSFSIGGATYARAFENMVSFGPTFVNDEDMCHKTNEFINIERLILMTKIYAEAIYLLNS